MIESLVMIFQKVLMKCFSVSLLIGNVLFIKAFPLLEEEDYLAFLSV